MVTLSELLEEVYRFYPRGWLYPYPGFDYTPESLRLRAAWVRGVEAYPTWKSMFDRLGLEHALTNRSLHLFSMVDSAYSALASFKADGHEYHLGFHVSFLGPYYVVHRMGRPGEEPLARSITRAIEATYPGYEPIPPELGDVEVPDVHVDSGPVGKATIYDCLLSPYGGRGPTESRDPNPQEIDPATKAKRAAILSEIGESDDDEQGWLRRGRRYAVSGAAPGAAATRRTSTWTRRCRSSGRASTTGARAPRRRRRRDRRHPRRRS